MNTVAQSQASGTDAGFALISVLALVSLAAMTATAFLASARLERQATRPLTQSAQLELALAAGDKCMEQLIADASEPAEGTAKNFVTTLWRGTNVADYTNETGYLLIGEPNALNNVKWTYYAGFSPAGLTKFTTNVIETAIRFTNIHQGTFSNDSLTFMSAATNGFIPNPPITNTVCTTIELLGGQVSPPVGWVYLTQRKRPAGSLIDVETPVARVAWFTEDLAGKIDAERMGGLSTSRLTGTNPEEICLTSLIRTNGATILPNTSLLTNVLNRKLFFTPGLLANATVSGLTNPADLRYFASGLREFRPTNTVGGTNGYLSWVPAGIPIAIQGNSTNSYSSSGFSKANLNDYLGLPPSSALNDMTNLIRRNLPNFTNRAGGMNGTNYALALAANILDYADISSTPTTTNINGANIIGFDNYPMITHVFDTFTYSQDNRNITHKTWIQFWNPSTQPTATGNVTVTFTNKDIVRYPIAAAPGFSTNSLYSSTEPTTPQPSTTFSLPTISPNCGYVTNFTRPLILLSTFPSFPETAPSTVWLNCPVDSTDPLPLANSVSNSFSYSIGTTVITPSMTLRRQNDTLNNNVPNFSAGFLAGNQFVAATAAIGTPLPIHDPRMIPYLGLGTSSQYAQTAYATTYWRGYVSQNNLPFGLADPAFWPDAASRSVANHGTTGALLPNGPIEGLFTNSNSITGLDPAPCKLSNFGSYTNICELGNIFDPIQWAPSDPTGTFNYSNCIIDNTWTTNRLYGGGSTLRIGRAEHSRFAFTNFGGTGNPIPNMGQSAAALLDLFCVTNGNNDNNGGGPFRTGGKININTAPYPVLAALAGGIVLAKDPNKAGNTTNALMINAFANGVMRFRHLYPFLSPSQLLFISVNYGLPNWTNSAVWSNAAVFSRNQGLQGVASINDEGLEEWFSKIYELSSVSSDNYRVYIVAQLVATNAAGQTNAIGPIVRKYVHFSSRPNTGSTPFSESTNGVVKMYNWTITKGIKKTYESPY
jgi:hypothetical protein